jgi:hypothetical protein
MKKWLQDNQVLLTGLITSIIVALQQFLGTGKPVDWIVVGFSVLVAASAWAGNNLRGKGVSVAGLIGAAGYAFATTAINGHIDLNQLILAFVIAAGALIAPPPKPASYETNPTIVAAKQTPTK